MASPHGASHSHTLDTPLSVGLLCTSDQSDAETSTWQHATFEPTIPAREGPQTYVLDRTATGICNHMTIDTIT
jgi:hypothetical protein